MQGMNSNKSKLKSRHPVFPQQHLMKLFFLMSVLIPATFQDISLHFSLFRSILLCLFLKDERKLKITQHSAGLCLRQNQNSWSPGFKPNAITMALNQFLLYAIYFSFQKYSPIKLINFFKINKGFLTPRKVHFLGKYSTSV